MVEMMADRRQPQLCMATKLQDAVAVLHQTPAVEAEVEATTAVVVVALQQISQAEAEVEAVTL
jgi:hypothetical protein